MWTGFLRELPEKRGHTTLADLREIGPTYYFAPPRVFETLLTTRDDPDGGRRTD